MGCCKQDKEAVGQLVGFSGSCISTCGATVDKLGESSFEPWIVIQNARHCLYCHKSVLLCRRKLTQLSDLQLADDVEDKAHQVTEGTPEVTEHAVSEAEKHADNLAKNARPTAQELSESIEGTADTVAKGALQLLHHFDCVALSALEPSPFVHVCECFCHLSVRLDLP